VLRVGDVAGEEHNGVVGLRRKEAELEHVARASQVALESHLAQRGVSVQGDGLVLRSDQVVHHARRGQGVGPRVAEPLARGVASHHAGRVVDPAERAGVLWQRPDALLFLLRLRQAPLPRLHSQRCGKGWDRETSPTKAQGAPPSSLRRFQRLSLSPGPTESFSSADAALCRWQSVARSHREAFRPSSSPHKAPNPVSLGASQVHRPDVRLTGDVLQSRRTLWSKTKVKRQRPDAQSHDKA
jgi:hypothetical protein